MKSLYSFISLLWPVIPNPPTCKCWRPTVGHWQFQENSKDRFPGFFLGKELPGMWRFGVRFITLKWFLGSGYLISSHVTPVTLFRLCFIIFTKLAVWGPSLKWSTQNSSKVLSGRHFLHPFFTYMRSTSHFMAIALILDLFKLGIYNVLHFTKAWFGSKRLKRVE